MVAGAGVCSQAHPAAPEAPERFVSHPLNLHVVRDVSRDRNEWPATAASSTTFAFRSALRPTIATLASASAKANALPRPWLLPVTIAVLPEGLNGDDIAFLPDWMTDKSLCP